MDRWSLEKAIAEVVIFYDPREAVDPNKDRIVGILNERGRRIATILKQFQNEDDLCEQMGWPCGHSNDEHIERLRRVLTASRACLLEIFLSLEERVTVVYPLFKMKKGWRIVIVGQIPAQFTSVIKLLKPREIGNKLPFAWFDWSN